MNAKVARLIQTVVSSPVNMALLRWAVVPMATFLLAALVARQILRATEGSKDVPFQQAMTEAARAYLGGNRARALEKLQAASRLAPRAAEVHSDLAAKFQALGEHRRAAEHIEQMLRLNSALGGAPAFAQLVQMHLENGDDRDASRLVQQDLLLRWPEAPETAYAKGLIALHEAKSPADVEKAGQCFESCLRLNPGYIAAQIHLGIVRWRLGQLSKAEPLLRDALKREPNNTAALFHLGQVLRAQGKLEESERCLLQHKSINALAERGRHLQMRYSLGQAQPGEVLELGRIFGQLGQFQRAVSTFRVYTRLKPADPQGHEELARAADHLEDRESARTERELALALAKPGGPP